MVDPARPATAFTTRTGVVASFDDVRGTGEITDDDQAHTWGFHCTRIADGSRTIDPGTRVTYRTQPGPGGIEAVAVQAAAETRS